jgi:hypothetical protein
VSEIDRPRNPSDDEEFFFEGALQKEEFGLPARGMAMYDIAPTIYSGSSSQLDPVVGAQIHGVILLLYAVILSFLRQT